MESNSNFLANRQLAVIKSNLITVFRYAVKALIDKACFCSIDDGCEEFINFSAAMEQVLQHRLRPSKTWYGGEDRNSFWFYLKAACHGRDMLSCINNIDNIENIRSPLAKGHAFLRYALMEKRLADYLTQALKQTALTRRFYQEGAIMLGDEAMELCGVLLGLNAIDFGFCLKGENFDIMPHPLAINYVPFMKFKQSAESLCSDAEEMRELSSCASSIISEDAQDGTMETGQDRYQLLLKRYLCVLEQKSFLEEVAASQEKVLETAAIAQQQQQQQQQDMQQQQQQYEAVILELQAQVVRMKKVNESLHQQLILARHNHLPLTDMGGSNRFMASSFAAAIERRQQNSDEQSVKRANSHLGVAHSVDTRSMVSAISDLSEVGCAGGEGQQELGERQGNDTQSMVPLAGSLTDLSEPRGDNSVVTLGAPKSDPDVSTISLSSEARARATGKEGGFDELNGNNLCMQGEEITFCGHEAREAEGEEEKENTFDNDLQGSIIVLKDLETQAIEVKTFQEQSDEETESEEVEVLTKETQASLESSWNLTPTKPAGGIPTSATSEDFPLHCSLESPLQSAIPGQPAREVSMSNEDVSDHKTEPGQLVREPSVRKKHILDHETEPGQFAGEVSVGNRNAPDPEIEPGQFSEEACEDGKSDHEILTHEEMTSDKKSAGTNSDKEEMSEPEILAQETSEQEGTNSDGSGSDIAKDTWDMVSDASSQ